MEEMDSFTVEDIDHLPLVQKLKSDAIGHEQGFIRIHPYNQVFPGTMKRYVERILDFHVNSDDTFVGSFPKCGTTWTQELVWCLLNNLDYEKSSATILDERVPYFEWTAISKSITVTTQQDCLWGKDSLSLVADLPTPRIIKTHLKFDMLPSALQTYLGQASNTTPKFIYVSRNPRDACVSLFYHWKLLEGYQGSFDDFAELFLNDLSGFYCPFFAHVISYWDKRDNPNILFLKYEDMKHDLPSVIQKVATFLNKEISDEGIKDLAEHLSFKSFKSNPALNRVGRVKHANDVHSAKIEDYKKPEHGFIRKGQVGDWVNHFSDVLLQKFIEWEKKAYGTTELRFDYE